MESLINSLNHAPGLAVLILIIGLILLLAFVLVQFFAIKQMKTKWGRLMADASGTNIEELLQRHINDQEVTTAAISDSKERLDTLEKKMKTAKRYIGLIRYDAFEEVGGSQSFALACYDEEGNGVVLTSQVGREGCRVYGKTLVHGKSERPLSSEEEMAIEQATSQRSRPRISS